MLRDVGDRTGRDGEGEGVESCERMDWGGTGVEGKRWLVLLVGVEGPGRGVGDGV